MMDEVAAAVMLMKLTMRQAQFKSVFRAKLFGSFYSNTLCKTNTEFQESGRNYGAIT